MNNSSVRVLFSCCSWSFCRFVKKQIRSFFSVFLFLFCSDFPADMFFFFCFSIFWVFVSSLFFGTDFSENCFYYLCAAFFNTSVTCVLLFNTRHFVSVVDSLCWIMRPDPPRSQPPFVCTVSAANPRYRRKTNNEAFSSGGWRRRRCQHWGMGRAYQVKSKHFVAIIVLGSISRWYLFFSFLRL